MNLLPESYEEALEIVHRRRRGIPPALYNVLRLNELPIPNVNRKRRATTTEIDTGLQNDESAASNRFYDPNDSQPDEYVNNDHDNSVLNRENGIGFHNIYLAARHQHEIDHNDSQPDTFVNNDHENSVLDRENGIGIRNNDSAAENQREIDRNAHQPVASDKNYHDNSVLDRENSIGLRNIDSAVKPQHKIDQNASQPDAFDKNDHDNSVLDRENGHGFPNNDSTAENQCEIDTIASHLDDSVNNSRNLGRNSAQDREDGPNFRSNESAADIRSEIGPNGNACIFEEISFNELASEQCSNANDEPVIDPLVEFVGAADDPVKTEPVFVFEPFSSNCDELESLLEDDSSEETVSYDEEVTYTINKKVGFARPYRTNSENLIKREDDIVSGNMAYNESVSIIIINIENLSSPSMVIFILVHLFFRKLGEFICWTLASSKFR